MDLDDLALIKWEVTIRRKPVPGAPPEPVSAAAVAKVLTALSDAGFRLETATLKRMASVAGFPLAKSLQLLKRRRLRIVEVHAARTGSIIVGGVIGAVLVWVVKATVGKSLEEAWKQSQIHQKIVDILLLRRRAFPAEVSKQLAASEPPALKSPPGDPTDAVRLLAEIDESGKIRVRVRRAMRLLEEKDMVPVETSNKGDEHAPVRRLETSDRIRAGTDVQGQKLVSEKRETSRGTAASLFYRDK